MTAADGLRFRRGSGPWFEYTYDYMGGRVRRKVYTRQADTTRSPTHDQVFVYDGWRRGGAERRRDGLRPLQRGQQGDASRPSTFPVLVLDATDSNAVTRTFTWGLDLSGTLQGAGGIGGLLRLDDTDDVYFYTCDANGNISELIDDSGNTDAHYEYTPFGSQVVATGPCAAENPFRFSTKHHEEQIELYYYGFRYYSPRLGRWLNRDPIGEEGGINLYGIVQNNAISKYDPLGECSAQSLANARSLLTSYLETALGLPFVFPLHSNNPHQHCVWNCRMTRVMGASNAAQQSWRKEMIDWSMANLRDSLQADGCWCYLPANIRDIIQDHADSAMQLSDFIDNATGIMCGLTICDDDPFPWNDTLCEECCSRAGVGPTTPEGEGTSRPYGPRSQNPRPMCL
jgi:RHS repeat-associated protein